MSQTLTALITKVQNKLIDDGTRFNTTTCTEALRNALAEMNTRIPIQTEIIIDAIADQQEYNLNNEDSRVIGIEDVLEYENGGENHEPLEYDDYVQEEMFIVRLREPQQSGEILFRYTVPHTINGLDSETNSTLSTHLEEILTDGACAEALNSRRLSRVETINLQKEVPANYEKAIIFFRDAFNKAISLYETKRKKPVSEPRTDAWNNI